MTKELDELLEEQSGIADISGVRTEDAKQSLYIALENDTVPVIGWCDAKVSLDEPARRCPVYLLNGKPFPHIMADGDYVK